MGTPITHRIYPITEQLSASFLADGRLMLWRGEHRLDLFPPEQMGLRKFLHEFVKDADPAIARADAMLIAAAPELLAVATQALLWLESLDPERERAHDGLDRLRTAIARAEGRVIP